MKQHREPTKLMRVRVSIYSVLRMMSAVRQKTMTALLEELISPVLKKHGLEMEKIANSTTVEPLTNEKEAQENVNK